MSTEINVQLLQTIHRILIQQADLNGRIRRGPLRIEVAQKAEAAFQATLDERNAALKETKFAADRKQKQLAEREAAIEILKTKRNACDSNREFQLYSDQIAADEQANSVQSDEILELLEKIDAIEAEVFVATGNLEKGKAETAKVTKIIQDELAVLDRDLAEVNSELEVHEGKMPVDIRNDYRRVVKAAGEDALAKVDDNSCGHCYTTLTTQLVSDLMMQQAKFCKNCGSLLYFPKNATV